MGREFKGRAADSQAERPDPEARVFLLSGDDDGAVADAADSILASYGRRGDARIRQIYSEDRLKEGAGALVDELLMQPLIGEAPAVFLRLANERQSATLVKALLSAQEVGGGAINPLLILMPKLRAGSKLRSTVAGLERGVVLEFVTEKLADVVQRISEAIAAEGLTIEAEALSAFAQDLPGHRLLARQEIEKLCLYGRGLGRAINLSDVETLSAVDTSAALFTYLDAVIEGHGEAAHRTLQKLLVSGTAPYAVFRALHREFERMLDAAGRIAAGEAEPALGMSLGPPVMNWAWPRFRARLNTWTAPRLMRAMARLREADGVLKTAGPLSEALVSELTTAFSSLPRAR